MVEADKQAKAEKMFETLCQTLDKRDWKYEKGTNGLYIDTGCAGEDIPIEIRVLVDADRQIVRVLSHMPVQVPEDKRLEMAIAISCVNNVLADGCFDFDIHEGLVFYRMGCNYIDKQVGEEALEYLVFCSIQIIEQYNDQFLMLAKGLLPLQQFLESNS